MYSWTTIRAFSVVLLCLPLLHIALLGGRIFVDYLNPSPEVWRGQLQEIIERDEGARLPESPILITGGRAVRLWEGLDAMTLSRPLVMRPLGDATLEDLAYHYERLVGFYRPSVLIVMPSYSDLYLRDDKTPAEFREALRGLLTVNQSMGVSSYRYVIMPVTTLLHSSDSKRLKGIHAAVASVAASLPNTIVLDANPLLANAAGDPDPRYFRFGGIYLNSAGYAIMTEMLQQRLSRDGII